MTLATDILNLPEGRVLLEYPREMSPESIQDVEDYFCLLLRKLRRGQARGRENAAAAEATAALTPGVPRTELS